MTLPKGFGRGWNDYCSECGTTNGNKHSGRCSKNPKSKEKITIPITSFHLYSLVWFMLFLIPMSIQISFNGFFVLYAIIPICFFTAWLVGIYVHDMDYDVRRKGQEWVRFKFKDKEED